MRKTFYLLLIYLLIGYSSHAEVHTQSQVTYLFTAQNGLSSTKVTSILQDDKGYMWFGTEDGLNRHDGFDFVVYKNDPKDTFSIKNNRVTALFMDSGKRIWIASIEGLSYYEPVNEKFINVDLNLPDYVIKDNHCADMIEDRIGRLWFTSTGVGMVCYSPKTNESRLLSKPDLCSNYMQTVLEDRDGNIWFGSLNDGITVYDPEKESFVHYNTSNSQLCGNSISDLSLMANGNILISSPRGGVTIYDVQKEEFISYPDVFDTADTRSIYCAMEDHEGYLLLGTENKGVLIFDPEKRTIRQHPIFKEYSDLVGDSKVRYIYEGAHNYLWIALNYKGVYCVGHEDSGFKSLRKVNNEPNSLNCSPVTGVTTDRDRVLWIATDGGGVNRYDPSTEKFTHYTHNPKDLTTLSDNAVTSIFCDSKNRIWVSTYSGGLNLLNRESGTFTHFRAGKSGLPSDYVNKIQEDKDGCLWLATFGGGLARLNPETMEFKTFRAAENPGLPHDYFFMLTIDNKNRLWVGSRYGLSCMDMETQTFRSFFSDSGLSSITIFSIAEDPYGTIWVGTARGLNKFNEENGTFTLAYPLKEELSSTINAIVPHNNQLWMSTNHGIIRYTPEINEVKRYYYNSGLTSNEFIAGSHYKSPDGQIFFGNISGLNFFYPEDIYNYDMASVVYFTNLKINNEIVGINQKVDGNIILTKNISETKRIKLKHTIKNFTLDYVSMGIFDSYSVVYAFKLEGFDDHWVYSDYRTRSLTYTNLNPGKYTLYIKASSNPDVWGEESTSLIIDIVPPPWKTWWAKLLYVVVSILVVFLILRFAFIRIREKNEMHIQRLKMKQQQEVNEIKTNFFTNVSHEFRTPLTLIIGPLKRLIKEVPDENNKKTAFLMLRNVERLQQLVNQILDINKIEDGKMKLSVQEIDLVTFIAGSIHIFTELTDQKQIDLIYRYDPDHIDIWYDPDMLDKCMNNLLYNAYKFTPQGGKIEVNLKKEDDRAVLTISDSGIGMKKETLEHLFDRFYQGDKSRHPGSGIGMHLTKTLIELHKGTISVNSEEGKGTTFTITFLFGNKQFKPEELSGKTDAESMGDEGSFFHYKEFYTSSALSAQRDPNDTKPMILLVEDDTDMRMYIRQELEDRYRVEEAVNGAEGIEKARQLMPDLIITDLMMPEMKGTELCKVLKTDIETSHIPIIMLTALADIGHRIEGLETGADSYIPKPFNSDYLKARIENLLELRRKLKERFSKSVNVDAKELVLTSTDERLLQNVIDYIRNNMESVDLSVETMSKELGISRTHLHRKLKALTGQSPIEFIKMIKMKQAAYFLSTGKLSIAEVAYKVGYNTPSYFSSSFNAYFGMSPTAYIESNTKTDHPE